jgi:hypothetical protein
MLRDFENFNFKLFSAVGGFDGSTGLNTAEVSRKLL